MVNVCCSNLLHFIVSQKLLFHRAPIGHNQWYINGGEGGGGGASFKMYLIIKTFRIYNNIQLIACFL